jgi:hypothetical protein
MTLAHVQFMFNHFWPLPFASRVLREATSIAISLPVLCELVWVWQRLCLLCDGCLAWRWLFGLLVQRWKLSWPRRRLLETSPMG